MPLMHKKTPGSFKRKSEHERLAHGGSVEECPHCYDDGGNVSSSSSDDKGSHWYDPSTWSNEDQAQAAPRPKPTGSNAGSDTGAKKLGAGWKAAGLAKGGKVEKEDERPKPNGTLENYHETGKNKPVGMMQREQDLKDFKRQEGPKLKGLAEGGEVEGDDADDSEIHEMLGQEMMDAIHKKDHKRVMQGIEACVLSCMNKHKE
jgi:hypothetical protein